MSPDATMGYTSSFARQFGHDANGLSGVLVTAGSPAHDKGAWVQIAPDFGEGIPYDSYGLKISIDNKSGNVFELHEIGIGAPGSEIVVVTRIPTFSSDSFAATVDNYFPLFIPRGSLISARCQASSSFTITAVNVILFGKHGYASNVYKRCVTFGGDEATSKGTMIDPGATANTLGAWVSVGLPAPHRIHALSVWLCMDNNTAADASWIMEYAVLEGQLRGVPNADEIIQKRHVGSTEGGSDMIAPASLGPFPFIMEEGDILRVRMQSTWATSPDRRAWLCCFGFG